jgi:hypothetical protein
LTRVLVAAPPSSAGRGDGSGRSRHRTGRTIDIDTRLTALDIRAQALDFLGDRVAPVRPGPSGGKAARRAAPRPSCAVFQLGKQIFGGGR